MELRRYLGILRRRLWMVVALLIVGAVLGGLATSQTPSYATSATIYVGSSNFSFGSAAATANGVGQSALATDLIPTYAKMLQSQPIAAAAAARAGFGLTAAEVQADTAVTSEANTTLLTVSATNANPSVAQALANSVAQAFTAKLKALQPPGSQGAVPSAPAYVFQQAGLPTSPLPLKTRSNVTKGGLVGLVLGLGLAGLLEYLDVTVKGPADAEQRLDLPVLGVIPLRRANA